ncbi:hypothetical protein DNL40_07005 [Xylanimonas oleitrophica]|uniref:Tyr recombinase domain-containing protein n=1 Tax=Xylanimonas oleitrophica TaxID=2607479 RepID=A0A2W5XUC8_9MICO|nr:hypothetical protein DNL40_07005 [Xylanimonas oleitrophica]
MAALHRSAGDGDRRRRDLEFARRGARRTRPRRLGQRRARVDGDRDFPRLTPHDLRHTTASLAFSAGAHIKALQRMLGHASAAMTLDFDHDLDPWRPLCMPHVSRSHCPRTIQSRNWPHDEGPVT